jgi:hypothetical protein
MLFTTTRVLHTVCSKMGLQVSVHGTCGRIQERYKEDPLDAVSWDGKISVKIIDRISAKDQLQYLACGVSGHARLGLCRLIVALRSGISSGFHDIPENATPMLYFEAS